MMKKVLVVSACGKRRDTIGLVGGIISSLSALDKSEYNISLFDTDFFERNHNPKDYDVDNYYALDKQFFCDVMRKIPCVRMWYSNYLAVKTFKRLLEESCFDVVIVYQIPSYADKLVKVAHDNGVKIIFEPFGSDILRVTANTKKHLTKAFSEVDGVVGRSKSGTLIAAKNDYHVPDSKIKEQVAYVKGVQVLSDVSGKLSRKEMMGDMKIPYSDYNIVCGYSGRESHRHRTIIDALIKVKDVLPKGYQIIFPMTYGAGAHHEIIINYAAQLKSVCDAAALNTVFMTDFMTSEQMAYLHLITDLFIEIQPTDNGNAFMIEALYAGNQIVTGRWLNYERFEQFGIPYYLIDSPDDLPNMLRNIFIGQVDKSVVPPQLIDFLAVPKDYVKGEFWMKLLEDF